MKELLLEEFRGQFGKGWSAQEIIAWVEGLPPMPEVAAKALRLLNDLNCTADQLAAVLMRDAALTSQILRAANSSVAGRHKPASKLPEAIHVVGFEYLTNLIVASITRQWNGSFGRVERVVWEKSIGTAVATRVVLQRMGSKDQEKLFLAGLLHNLGQVVMLSHPEIRKKYPQVLGYITKHRADFCAAEREIIGFSHPLVGALVANKWQFPYDLCKRILNYPEPLCDIDSHDVANQAPLNLAALLCHRAGIGVVDGYPQDEDQLRELALALDFPAETMEQELQRMDEAIRAKFAAEAAIFN